MLTIETKPLNVMNYLNKPDDMAQYLDAALEEGDLAYFRLVLGDVARELGIGEAYSA